MINPINPPRKTEAKVSNYGNIFKKYIKNRELSQSNPWLIQLSTISTANRFCLKFSMGHEADTGHLAYCIRDWISQSSQWTLELRFEHICAKVWTQVYALSILWPCFWQTNTDEVTTHGMDVWVLAEGRDNFLREVGNEPGKAPPASVHQGIWLWGNWRLPAHTCAICPTFSVKRSYDPFSFSLNINSFDGMWKASTSYSNSFLKCPSSA